MTDFFIPRTDHHVIDLDGDNELPGLLEEHEALKRTIKMAKKRKAEIEIVIKSKLGAAEGATLSGNGFIWEITHKVHERKEKLLSRKWIQTLRITRQGDLTEDEDEDF